MTNIRRFWEAGFPYFTTHVTYGRNPLLIENIDLWWKSVVFVKEIIDFELAAWVILPDHMHLLLESHDTDLTLLIKRLKMKFSGLYRARHGQVSGRVWQYRFWDHRIRNQEDYNNHINYIHYNPVKHGICSNPKEYEHSSFRLYCEKGYYSSGWGAVDSIDIGGDYGE